mmetsp:Transcript_32999/g.72380  ORF Transcript_32999/g.72380 Transcript_32999/m.72380 type:complete len:206 (-) Transcript_32999:183-800(-)|eukprot:CAMPEP_0178659570 /NCGR_PEP_ID=MMETSP0698-20121128/26634_1 /TAXON_ID=265572 /ORGANISM="Extubocellulus spinifer, Strain CCMP396" /LENGTH=205 /DNA_ID=CAMNT_0020302113 /DNA_START=291 /DNA_END=908 /DNA_ORIENTATION=+
MTSPSSKEPVTVPRIWIAPTGLVAKQYPRASAKVEPILNRSHPMNVEIHVYATIEVNHEETARVGPHYIEREGIVWLDKTMAALQMRAGTPVPLGKTTAFVVRHDPPRQVGLHLHPIIVEQECLLGEIGGLPYYEGLSGYFHLSLQIFGRSTSRKCCHEVAGSTFEIAAKKCDGIKVTILRYFSRIPYRQCCRHSSGRDKAEKSP